MPEISSAASAASYVLEGANKWAFGLTTAGGRASGILECRECGDGAGAANDSVIHTCGQIKHRITNKKKNTYVSIAWHKVTADVQSQIHSSSRELHR
jgi:hypothetical protein